MHAKPNLRVILKWRITGSGSVNANVIQLAQRTMNIDDENYELKIVSLANYLDETDESRAELIERFKDRELRSYLFPHSVMLKITLQQLTLASRWCFEKWGLPDGPCYESYSGVDPYCTDESAHSHMGDWAWNFYVKTDYDYGFSEWSFKHQPQLQEFREMVPVWSKESL